MVGKWSLCLKQVVIPKMCFYVLWRKGLPGMRAKQCRPNYILPFYPRKSPFYAKNRVFICRHLPSCICCRQNCRLGICCWPFCRRQMAGLNETYRHFWNCKKCNLVKKNFVKLIYLISRVFFGLFKIFWPVSCDMNDRYFQFCSKNFVIHQLLMWSICTK